MTEFFYAQTACGHPIVVPQVIGDYSIVKVIDSGSFSVVFEVKKTGSNELYALKAISRAHMVKLNIVSQLEQEIRILENIRHPNIIRLEKVVYVKDYIYLVMERCRCDLFTDISKNGPIISRLCKMYFDQICSAVQCLHQHNIAHNDLKPENILISYDGNIKLTDFGSIISKDDQNFIPEGTLRYLPPEAFTEKFEKNYFYNHKKADIWSLGMIRFMMETAQMPWINEISKEIIGYFKEDGSYEIPYTALSYEGKTIISACLQIDPNLRPSIEKIIEISEKYKPNGYKGDWSQQYGVKSRNYLAGIRSANECVIKKQLIVKPTYKKDFIKTSVSSSCYFSHMK